MKNITSALVAWILAQVFASGQIITSESGSVTNAALNAAIATDPAATRNSLSVSRSDKHLRGLANSINISGNTGNFPVSIIQLGDSFSDFAKFGYAGHIVGSFKCSAINVDSNSITTAATTDYTKSPDGIYYAIPDGKHLTCGHVDSGAQGPATHVYYTLFTGTGTAQMQWSNNGGAWTNVGSTIDTTAIAANTASVARVSLGAQYSNVRTRVTATGGTVNGFIGQGTDGPGLTVTQFGVVGQELEQTCQVAENVWKAMIAGYQESGSAQLVFCTFLDQRFTTLSGTPFPVGTEGWGASGPLQSLHNWSKTANATVDWMVIGPHGIDPTLTAASNATVDALYTALGIGSNLQDRTVDASEAQREFALRNNEGYVHCLELFPDFTKATTAGLYEDDKHLSALGEAYKRAFVWTNSNIGWILGNVNNQPRIRMGNIFIAPTKTRASEESLMVYSANTNPSLRAITGSYIRSGNPLNAEQQGVQFYYTTASSLTIANVAGYGPGGATVYAEWTHDGTAPQMRPATTTTAGSAIQSALGSSSRRWGESWTAGLCVGYVAKTADYTLTRTDHTVDVTANSPTITLPTAVGFAGKIFVIANTGAGTITMATTSSQTIDGASPGTIAAGARLKVQSTGANYITIP